MNGLADSIKGLALSVGFDVAGIAEARPTPETEWLREWLSRGYGGSMGYLERRCEERVDPRRVLEGARSIVVGGLVYAANNAASTLDSHARPSGDRAVISRYAGGADYHDVMIDRLRGNVATTD